LIEDLGKFDCTRGPGCSSKLALNGLVVNMCDHTVQTVQFSVETKL